MDKMMGTTALTEFCWKCGRELGNSRTINGGRQFHPECDPMLTAEARLAEAERENYRLSRMEEARAKQPDWEKLWAEQIEKLEAAEARIATLTEAGGALHKAWRLDDEKLWDALDTALHLKKMADESHPCDTGCQYSKDIGMWPEYSCGNGCIYDTKEKT